MTTTTATTPALAQQRADAAEQLETAIAALGVAYGDYQRATRALEARVGQDLGRYLEGPIVLHLVQAGLSAFLERRLTGRPSPLRDLVDREHARAGV